MDRAGSGTNDASIPLNPGPSEYGNSEATDDGLHG